MIFFFNKVVIPHTFNFLFVFCNLVVLVHVGLSSPSCVCCCQRLCAVFYFIWGIETTKEYMILETRDQINGCQYAVELESYVL